MIKILLIVSMYLTGWSFDYDKIIIYQSDNRPTVIKYNGFIGMSGTKIFNSFDNSSSIIIESSDNKYVTEIDKFTNIWDIERNNDDKIVNICRTVKDGDNVMFMIVYKNTKSSF